MEPIRQAVERAKASGLPTPEPQSRANTNRHAAGLNYR